MSLITRDYGIVEMADSDLMELSEQTSFFQTIRALYSE